MSAPIDQSETELLRRAVDGLLYPSESDQPFEVFAWPAAAGSAADQVSSHADGRPIVELGDEQFFNELKDADDAARFVQLRYLLGSLLTELKVLRVGKAPDVRVYVAGKSKSGQWLGLRTVSIET